MFKKVYESTYLNLDNIIEIGVCPHDHVDMEGNLIWLIMYWDIAGEENQLPGWYKTKEDAISALEMFMEDIVR